MFDILTHSHIVNQKFFFFLFLSFLFQSFQWQQSTRSTLFLIIFLDLFGWHIMLLLLICTKFSNINLWIDWRSAFLIIFAIMLFSDPLLCTLRRNIVWTCRLFQSANFVDNSILSCVSFVMLLGQKHSRWRTLILKNKIFLTVGRLHAGQVTFIDLTRPTSVFFTENTFCLLSNWISWIEKLLVILLSNICIDHIDVRCFLICSKLLLHIVLLVVKICISFFNLTASCSGAFSCVPWRWLLQQIVVVLLVVFRPVQINNLLFFNWRHL